MSAWSLSISQAYNYPDLAAQRGGMDYIVKVTPGPGGELPGPADVQDAVIAQAPAYIAAPANILIGIASSSSTQFLLTIQDCIISHITDALWLAKVIYQRQQPRDRLPEAGGLVLDFDTSGGKQHLLVAKATTSYVPSGGSVVDVKKVIGQDGKGKVHGVDVGYGVYRWSEEWTLVDTSPPATPANGIAATACTSDYRIALKGLTYKTNNATFRGYAVGEVLFVGAVGRRIKGGAFSVTYRFEASENLSNVAVGDIAVSTKKGWQYLDVMYADAVSGGSLLQVPTQANVHDVYDSADFSLLKIGTGTI